VEEQVQGERCVFVPAGALMLLCPAGILVAMGLGFIIIIIMLQGPLQTQ
jgi:hypothetical protein